VVTENFPFRGAVFDLDGTLLDTLEDIANAANEVLESLGLPVHPRESYKYFVGDGVRVLMERVLPESWRTPAKIETCLARMRESYLVHLNRSARAYPEVLEVLKVLRERNCRLAVLSNKPHHLTEICIKEYFSDFGFEPVFGLRPGHSAKPDPAGAREILDFWKLQASEVLYFGDTSTDMETAVNAGMFPVGVLWGFRQPEELTASGARVLLEHGSDLLNKLSDQPE